jgi:hypothetical protein
VNDSKANRRPPDLSIVGERPSATSPRAPLGEVKPPREWRSTHAPEITPPPRVVRHVPADEPAPPAGSVPPTYEAPPAGSAPAPGPPGPAPEAAPPGLPQAYGTDRLVILVRDPYWVFLWWELTDSTLAHGRRVIASDAQLVLRLYDITAVDWDGGNHHTQFDIEVWDATGNWYVDLGRPGSSFVAELGLRARDGRFLALLRSNFVTLPRDGMSPVVDEEWMVVEEEYRALFRLAGGDSIGIGSGEIQRMLEQRLRSELASGGVASFGVSSFGLSSPALSVRQD